MTATAEFVKDCFGRFNQLVFAGELPEIPVVLTRARTFLGKVEYKSVRGPFGRVLSTSDFRLKISTSYDLPQDELEDVVLHEMIHYYICLKRIKDSSSHGPKFRAMMERINSEYGRHVTVSHKLGEDFKTSGKPRLNYVCLSTFADGHIGVTVCTKDKVSYISDVLPRCFRLKGIQWFTSTDAYFCRFPRARSPKIYKISSDELAAHRDNLKALS